MLAVPPAQQSLPGTLPSLRVWLEGGDSQDLLAGVVEVVVVEVRKMIGPPGTAVLGGRYPLGDVGRVA